MLIKRNMINIVMVLLYKPSSFVCPKEEARKGHPTVPSACEADALRFSLLTGR